MAKGEKPTAKKKVDEYLAKYGEMTRKIQILSRMNVRQFLGTRDDGDPRVEYMAQLEAFRNLSSVQLAVLTEEISDMLGDKAGTFLKHLEQTLAEQIAAMEESLAVTGWKEDGTPILDLQSHLEKTKGWPM